MCFRSSAPIGAELPEPFRKLGISFPRPVRQTHRVYSVDDVVVTGWAGAMIKDGLLLTERPEPNWATSLRARPHKMPNCPAARPYFNLMTPIPARNHMFHWLFDSILPLVPFLESGRGGIDLGLIVNAELSEIQARTMASSRSDMASRSWSRWTGTRRFSVPQHSVRGRRYYFAKGAAVAAFGLALLDDIARYIAGDAALEATPRRIYVSRNDARLRRVLNEDAGFLPELKARGFERVTLAGMPIARQVALFLNAEAVVGPHGAASAHASWCRRRAKKIMEFIPGPDPRRKTTRPLANADFWFIALQRNLDYQCFLGGRCSARTPSLSRAGCLIRALDA